MKRFFTTVYLPFLFICMSTLVFAQDGEGIFKAKCNSCHLLDKESTGPMLKGVKQKWEDAGEGDLLIEWVKNSNELIASGKSTKANEIKTFSPMEMPVQEITKEELDAVLSFVDSYVAKVEPPVGPTNGDKKVAVTYVPNYKENLTLFYWLIASIIIILIGIFIFAASISTLAKSDYFGSKDEEDDTLPSFKINSTLLAIIGVFGVITAGSQSMALSVSQAAETATAGESTPWLKIENTDIYLLIGINCILLIVLFYLRRMFKNLISIKAPAIEEMEAPKTMKRINKFLSNDVPIEEEHTILMHHEYDGIKELDNNLPPWWVWMFVATIVFAVVYLFNYHVLKTSDLQVEEYNKEMKKAEREIKAYREEMSMNVDETNATLMTESSDLAEGKILFQTNCVSCHKDKGQGEVGPNLTDEFWIHGGDIKEVFKTINDGVPAMGMPAHNTKFNPIQVQQVASFVLSMPYVAGKEPQGEKVEKSK